MLMDERKYHIVTIAPSGKADQALFSKAKALVLSKGHTLEQGPNLTKSFGPFAGSDEERLNDLQWALDNTEADIIWMCRGGYGMTRILDQVDIKGFSQHPKLIIGYSDITALFLDPRFQDYPLVHADMFQFLEEGMLEKTLSLISSKTQLLTCESNEKSVSLKGEMIGGNLSLIVNQLGIIDKSIFNDKILLLEDLDENDYKIDRMMIQLKRSGILKSVKAIILGGFTDIKAGSTPMKDFKAELLQIVSNSGVPFFYNALFGHIKENTPLLLNLEADLKYQNGILDIRYSQLDNI